MPTYEYRCPKCGTVFEKIQKMTSRPGAKCPKCGGRAGRQLSPSGFVFKGSGFYITDYKRAGEKPEPSETATDKAEKPAAAPKAPSTSKPAIKKKER
jgi:putative FmdB family regulatory protein